jgi:hypothetical protein
MRAIRIYDVFVMDALCDDVHVTLQCGPEVAIIIYSTRFDKGRRVKLVHRALVHEEFVDAIVHVV